MKLDITFDTRKKMPLQDQFADSIKMLIAERKIAYGYQFETCQLIADDFGIDEEIIEKGFRILENHGYVKCIKGRYQLLPIMINIDFNFKVTSLYQALLDAGYHPRFETIEMKEVKKLPGIFEEQLHETYYYYKRLYFADDTPMVVFEGYFPKKYFNDTIDTYKNAFLYDHYKNIGLIPTKTDRTIHAVHPDVSVNNLLNHPKDVSSIQYIAKVYSQNQNLLECSISYASLHYTMYFKKQIHRSIKKR